MHRIVLRCRIAPLYGREDNRISGIILADSYCLFARAYAATYPADRAVIVEDTVAQTG